MIGVAPWSSPSDRRLARPDEVLFVRDARLSALAAFPERLRAAWCGQVDEQALAAAGRPVQGLRDLPDGPDAASEPFAYAVMTTAAAVLGPNGAEAKSALVALLDRWAQGDALARIAQPSANVYYALDRTLLPTLVAFALVRDDPALAPDRRQRIERWLAHLVRLRGSARPQSSLSQVTARNNHAYLRASVSMAWGALRGDLGDFRAGVDAYRRALRDMRRDGSLPLETRRGARALWYQRHAIASLVAIAEMAAVQGRDLYAEEIDGRSLHRAIRFLLDAIDDPRRVAAYAAADVNPRIGGDPLAQDLSFLEPRGHGRHYMAWAEIYMARFPARPEAQRLAALLRRARPEFRPMLDDYSGGNTTCFFAPPTRG